MHERLAGTGYDVINNGKRTPKLFVFLFLVSVTETWLVEGRMLILGAVTTLSCRMIWSLQSSGASHFANSQTVNSHLANTRKWNHTMFPLGQLQAFVHRQYYSNFTNFIQLTKRITDILWSVVHNHLARHNERGKKTRQTEEEVGRQHQGMDGPGVRLVPEGSGEQGKNGGNWLRNHLWCPNDARG